MYFQHNRTSQSGRAIRFTTRHEFLILTGFVAEALGLRKVLETGLQVKQKTCQHGPVDTVLPVLAGILGCRGQK